MMAVVVPQDGVRFVCEFVGCIVRGMGVAVSVWFIRFSGYERRRRRVRAVRFGDFGGFLRFGILSDIRSS